MSSSRRLRIYEYAGCSSCRQALRFLDREGIAYERVPIVDRPPGRAELEKMLEYLGGNLKSLFNTSGQAYRELGLSEKLPKMPRAEALALLASNGKLIKRPFVLTDGDGWVGFREQEWRRRLSR